MSQILGDKIRNLVAQDPYYTFKLIFCKEQIDFSTHVEKMSLSTTDHSNISKSGKVSKQAVEG